MYIERNKQKRAIAFNMMLLLNIPFGIIAISMCIQHYWRYLYALSFSFRVLHYPVLTYQDIPGDRHKCVISIRHPNPGSVEEYSAVQWRSGSCHTSIIMHITIWLPSHMGLVWNVKWMKSEVHCITNASMNTKCVKSQS